VAAGDCLQLNESLANSIPDARTRESAVATIDVAAGDGTAHLTRGVGGDWPEPINYDWLLAKVRNKAEEARGQMPDGEHSNVFVINVDSTTAMLSSDFIHRAEQEIAAVFDGKVRPYVLHFRHSVN
jgi:hypothetical protein